MKKNILLPIALVTALAITLFTSCTISINRNTAEGDEEYSNMKYEVKAFKGINAGLGNAEILFEESDTFSVIASAPQSVLDKMSVKVNDSILFIYYDKDESNGITWSDNGRSIHIKGMQDALFDSKIKVVVKAPRLAYLSCSGAIEFTAKKIKADSLLLIQSSGASEIKVENIVAKRTELHASGSCESEIGSIYCKDILFDTSGSGEIKANVYNANVTDLSASGAAEYDINFCDNCNKVRVMTSGAADITLKGQVNSMEKNIQGAADINIDDLKVKKASE